MKDEQAEGPVGGVEKKEMSMHWVKEDFCNSSALRCVRAYATLEAVRGSVFTGVYWILAAFFATFTSSGPFSPNCVLLLKSCCVLFPILMCVTCSGCT